MSERPKKVIPLINGKIFHLTSVVYHLKLGTWISLELLHVLNFDILSQQNIIQIIFAVFATTPSSSFAHSPVCCLPFLYLYFEPILSQSLMEKYVHWETALLQQLGPVSYIFAECIGLSYISTLTLFYQKSFRMKILWALFLVADPILNSIPDREIRGEILFNREISSYSAYPKKAVYIFPFVNSFVWNLNFLYRIFYERRSG